MKNKKLLIALLAILAVAVLVLSSCQKTEEKAKEAAAAVEEKVEGVKEEVKEEAAEAAEKVEEKVEEVKEEAAEVAEKVEEAVDTAKEEVADAAEKVEEAVDTAKEEAAEVAEKVEEAVDTAKEEVAEAAEKVEEAAASIAVMSHEEFVKAELDSPVCIEAYVQANQSWWDGKIKLYLQDENHGAYFAYDLPCTEEEAAKLAVPGTKVRITGVKAEWSGEVEIIDATYEILEGSFIAEPEDVTALFGKDELIDHMNEKIAVKDAKVAASKVEGKDEEFAFLYAWDGSGSQESNSDLYFNVEIGGQTYTFTVESYLCGNDTDVYKAVEGLKVGDTIDLEGFLYWYNGANPHITGVTVK
ncbi:MAG: hypothetical protein IKG23_03675 [Clostridia bacterium]|nr:hypothetical protein [Clostridia bacterium]